MKTIKISSDPILRPQRHSFGRLTSVLCIIVASWIFLLHGTTFERPFCGPQPEYVSSAPLQPTLDPAQSNHRTEVVQWDQYSLIIHGQRVLLWSGEVHPWRLPVPSLWRDVLEKIKAAGMNGISVYAHWGLHNPAPDSFEFKGFLDWQPFLDICKDVGLWVVFRPGPYINAETTGGGIPGWVLAEADGHLRSNGTSYRAAWTPYIAAISDVIRHNQITEGGPIILVQMENEYSSKPTEGPPFKAEMMQQLKEAFISHGVVVPLTHNDAGMSENYVSGLGSPDIYGFDSYPQGFNCSAPMEWNNFAKPYHQYHLNTNPKSPLYLPEVQAGAFDPWGPRSPTYEKCSRLTDSKFQTAFYHHLLASNARMVNLYMVFGGTSWGHLPFPGVYTSYDYGSAIEESRELGHKYGSLKSLGLFLRNTVDLRHTNVIGNSTDGTVVTNNDAVFATLLQNPFTKARFYFLRHTRITSTRPQQFLLDIATSAGPRQLPMTHAYLTLESRESRIILSDFQFGTSSVLHTSTAVLFGGVIDGRDVLFLHGDPSQAYEMELLLKGKPNGIHAQSGKVKTMETLGGRTLVTFLRGTVGLVTVWDSDQQLVLYSDSKTAETFYAPTIPLGDGPFRSYWQFGTNSTILVGGPHLVRSANLNQEQLELRGDLKESTRLTIIGISGVRRITWNGVPITGDFHALASGVFSVPLEMRRDLVGFEPPTLGPWKYHDSLPEIGMEYDDGDWVNATRTSSFAPKPLYGDGTVLYGCDYGFCEGVVLWRGYFQGNGVTGLRLAINGGEAFAASIFCNGHFLRTTYGNSTNNENIIAETDEIYQLPSDILKAGQNVLLVVQDNMGMDETGPNYDANASRSPRGIRGFELLPHGRFTLWKVQGKRGGYTSFVDRSRGLLNEGGLYAERQGWHLPSYDATSWTTRAISEGLPQGSAGIGFFRTEFMLKIPDGYDVPMEFVFDDARDGTPAYRALIFVNGWMMGKRVANLGPQWRFPVPEGVLHYQGNNTLAIAFWAMESEIKIMPRLSLAIRGIYDGGVKVNTDLL